MSSRRLVDLQNLFTSMPIIQAQPKLRNKLLKNVTLFSMMYIKWRWHRENDKNRGPNKAKNFDN